MSARLSLLILVAALCGTALTADAKPRRVVVLEFDGPRTLADSGREEVVALLGEQYDIVAMQRWEEARARAQRTSAGPLTWRRAAKSAGVDAVISGLISDDGRHKQLAVSVTEATTGTELDVITVRLDSKGLSRTKRAQLADQLDEILVYIDSTPDPLSSSIEVIETRAMVGSSRRRDTRPLPADRDEEAAYDDDEELSEDEEEEEEAPRKRKKRRVAAATGPDDNEDLVSLFGATSTEGKISDPSASHQPQPTPRFRLGAGAYYGSRSLNFGAENQGGPLPYSVPSKGLAVNAIAYPFPRQEKDGTMSGLGISVSLMKSAGSEVSFDDLDTVTEHTINQSSYEVGAHYRHPVTDLVSIDGGLSYGQSAYIFDGVPTSFEIPDTRYSYLGLGAKIDLNVTKAATVGFGGRYLYTLDTGDISAVDWYGPGRASGFGLDADFVIPLPSHLYVRGGLSWTKFSITFDGVGVITEEDGVYESRDSTVNGSVDIGVQF